MDDGGTLSRRSTVLVAVLALVAAGLALLVSGTPSAQAHEGSHGSVFPERFRDEVAIGGLSEPTVVDFAPDGTAFVGTKYGFVVSYDYADGAFVDPTPTTFADLSSNVDNYWDRGLVGLAVDPEFPDRPYVYVSYAYNRDPRDDPPVVPKWGDPASVYDDCPAPADHDVAGCLVSVRVSRLTAVRNEAGTGWVMAPGGERALVDDSCLQFPSHASGSVEIGPDGYLYASIGEGASFDFQDFGQARNPCGDPVDEGGSLRSQDVETAGDPTGLDGVVLRLDPDTGDPAPGNPLAGPDANARRIAAYGLRNPWRFTFRPGTTDLWVGDVGGNDFEEINRVRLPAGGTDTAENFGWPCYEGAGKQAAWESLAKPICESLYARSPSAVTKPVFSYPTRGGPLTPGEDCEEGTSSVSGVAFIPSTSDYPAGYRGALAFSDYARRCLWVLGTRPDGSPDPTEVAVLGQQVSTPVDLTVGPEGDLYYVDYGLDDDGVPTQHAGGVHRIAYYGDDQRPRAVLTAAPTYGALPLAVALDASGSTDPDEGDELTYAWDLDGDGAYDDGHGPTAQRDYDVPGAVTASVRVSDGVLADTAHVDLFPGNTPPTVDLVTPDASRTWEVGEKIEVAATGHDAEDGALPPGGLRWSLSIAHCPSVCHTHPVTTWTGANGSVRAPDHEYPSHLLLSVTPTDAEGLSGTPATVALEPRSVDLRFETSPRGLSLAAGGEEGTSSLARTFIVGSQFLVSAPVRQRVGHRLLAWRGWSDGGAATHEVAAPAAATTYVARYAPVRARLRIVSRHHKVRVRVDGRRHRLAWVGHVDVGARVRLAAPRRQRHGGRTYAFVRWSDGGNRRHRVRLDEGGTRLRVVYRRVR